MPGTQKLTPPSSAKEGRGANTSTVIAAITAAPKKLARRSFIEQGTTMLLIMSAPHRQQRYQLHLQDRPQLLPSGLNLGVGDAIPMVRTAEK